MCLSGGVINQSNGNELCDEPVEEVEAVHRASIPDISQGLSKHSDVLDPGKTTDPLPCGPFRCPIGLVRAGNQPTVILKVTYLIETRFCESAASHPCRGDMCFQSC